MDADTDDMPTWVKVSLVIALLLVVVVVLTGLLGIGDHGPARHEPGQHAPPGDMGASAHATGATPGQACQVQPTQARTLQIQPVHQDGGFALEPTCHRTDGTEGPP